jgi:K+-transporting ATPase ATPase C chain
MINFTFICGFLYPFSVTYVSNKILPKQSAGSLILVQDKTSKKEKIIGSSLIGQKFKSEKYFYIRPSELLDNGNDTLISCGSNLGPTNKKLIERVSNNYKRLKKQNLNDLIPLDLITESASGLDPHISTSSAKFQIPRVARVRRISSESLGNIIKRNTEPRQFGFLGEERVNVLKLNLDLDRVAAL